MAARNLSLIAESLGTDATELDAERFANLATSAGYTLDADGFTFLDASGAEMNENAWKQLLEQLADPMDGATDADIDAAARKLLDDIIDEIGEGADIDDVRAVLRDGNALLALGCTSTVVAEAADDEDMIAHAIAARTTVYAVDERDLDIVSFNLRDALARFGHEIGNPLLVSDECSGYFFAGSLKDCMDWILEQAAEDGVYVTADGGRDGVRKVALPTIESAKAVYLAELQLRGEAAPGDDSAVSVSIALDCEGERHYRIDGAGIYTNCRWADVDSADEWFDPEWFDYE